MNWRADGMGLEPRHHKRLAASARRDQPIGTHRRRHVVIGQENRQTRDVSVCSVRIPGANRQLLGRSLAVEHGRFGINVDAHDRRDLGHIVVGRAGLNPVVQRVVELARGLESLAAGVRNRTGGFLEKRALRRHRPVDSPAHHFTRQPEVVAFGIKAEKRNRGSRPCRGPRRDSFRCCNPLA